MNVKTNKYEYKREIRNNILNAKITNGFMSNQYQRLYNLKKRKRLEEKSN